MPNFRALRMVLRLGIVTSCLSKARDSDHGSADLVTGQSITLPNSPQDISPEDPWSEGEFATGELVTR